MWKLLVAWLVMPAVFNTISLPGSLYAGLESEARAAWGYSGPLVLVTNTEGGAGSCDGGNSQNWIAYTEGFTVVLNQACRYTETDPGWRAEEGIVMVHEVGHVLGLRHSLDPESVMYATDDPSAIHMGTERVVVAGTIAYLNSLQ